MEHPILPRRLWYDTKEGRTFLEQKDLPTRTEPLIILGEAGMGKTELLRWLAAHAGHAYCTARQLKNVRPDPRKLLGNEGTLIVDALDELSVQGEGDAVDLVLQKLGDVGYPRFILSCRVADWRNATGADAIREQYGDIDLLVLHLEPLTDEEVVCILASALDGDEERARAVVMHFTTRNLDGLLGNPQTLELVARVARDGPLPETKAALFEQAIELLRKEHSHKKADLQPDETTALDAAGAAFAALILTGSEAVVLEKAESEQGELPFAEVVALPGADKLKAVLGSRLFGGSANRFSYWHRRIGEYLGSRWLSRQADTLMKRKRLLGLFHSYGIVPVSLRGLHAWLAHHDKLLAADVIAADPMGVIEYGDADQMNAEHAHLLLVALQDLAKRNPRFREWQSYSLKSVVQPELLEKVRALVVDPNAEFGLRLLMIEAVKDSPIAEALRDNLRALMLDRRATFAHRSGALNSLVALGNEDWRAIVAALRAQDGDDQIRLAIEIVDDVGFLPFDDATIIELVMAQARHEHRTVGLFHRIERTVPNERLDGMLDELAAQMPRLGNRHERVGNNELTDFGYYLIARRLSLGDVEAARLWTWLEPFDAEVGYRRQTREEVHQLIRQNDQLRRAGQRHVLFELAGEKTIRQRAWRLSSRSPGFAPTPEDVRLLFDVLDPENRDDDKWRDLVQLTRHSETEGRDVREAAKRFVASRPDMLAWIDKLADPRVLEWQIKQEKERRQQSARRAMQWKEHRENFAKNIQALRQGDFGAVIKPAEAYLDLFRDLNHDLPAHERVAEWLGEDLARAAHEGFELFSSRRAHRQRNKWPKVTPIQRSGTGFRSS